MKQSQIIMIKDYSAPSKSAKMAELKVFDTKISSLIKLKTKWLVPLLLLLVLGVFLFFALQSEFRSLLGLSENRRLLLVKAGRPLAVLSFRVDEKQLFISDLRDKNLFSSDLPGDFSRQSQLLNYSFALGVILDEIHDYPFEDLSKASLLSFFKQQRPYRLFLQHADLLIRQQVYSGELPILDGSFFDCPLALINTTTATGLAGSMAKVLEQSAFLVVKKESNNDNLEQTKIVYDPNAAACTVVFDKLSKFLPGSLLVADQEAVKLQRSLIVIYLGQDLVTSLNSVAD